MKPNSNTDAEDDFWDLGDEDELPLVPASRSEENSEGEESSVDKEEVKEPVEDEVSKKNPKESSELEDADDYSDYQKEKEDAAISVDEEDEVQEVAKASRGIKGCLQGALASLSLVEKVSLLSVLVIFIGAASWGISTYYDQAPEGNLVSFTENFPVEGKHAAIAEIETYWRKPIRTGEDADHGVQLKARLIPCARIKLSGSGTAALAVSFRDSDQKLIGDPISLVVENGIFKKSGSAEIVITSTAGFENPSEINAYTNQDMDPWSVLIVEGAPGTNPSYTEADKKLAEVRISSVNRD